jgi:hypothetical protein
MLGISLVLAALLATQGMVFSLPVSSNIVIHKMPEETIDRKIM